MFFLTRLACLAVRLLVVCLICKFPFFLQPPHMLNARTWQWCSASSFPPNQNRNGSKFVCDTTDRIYFYIYILYHTVISVGTEYSSAVTLTWKTELHGTGTVACKWQSVPPNLCIILNMISVVLVFWPVFIFIVFIFFFWEESPEAVWQCNLDRKNIRFYVRLLL